PPVGRLASGNPGTTGKTGTIAHPGHGPPCPRGSRPPCRHRRRYPRGLRAIRSNVQKNPARASSLNDWPVGPGLAKGSRGCIIDHWKTSTPLRGREPMAKHIFVTGGVVSSLGKGLTCASIGMLLEHRGLRVRLQKFDPYINVDPGTMSPFQHGEVYVLDD